MRIITIDKQFDISQIATEAAAQVNYTDVGRLLTEEELDAMMNVLSDHMTSIGSLIHQIDLKKDASALALAAPSYIPDFIKTQEVQDLLKSGIGKIYEDDPDEILAGVATYQQLYRCTFAEMGFSDADYLIAVNENRVRAGLSRHVTFATLSNLDSVLEDIATMRILKQNVDFDDVFTDKQWQSLCSYLHRWRSNPGKLIDFISVLAATKIADPQRFSELKLSDFGIYDVKQLLIELRANYDCVNNPMFYVCMSMAILFNDIKFTDRGLQLVQDSVSLPYLPAQINYDV